VKYLNRNVPSRETLSLVVPEMSAFSNKMDKLKKVFSGQEEQDDELSIVTQVS